MYDSPLTRLLTSNARARLLQFLAIFSQDELRFRDVQRRIGVGSRSLQRELRCLASLGLIEKRGSGREARYRARTKSREWLSVWRMTAALSHPVEVVELVLAGLAGVEAAFVYGSTARDDARVDSDVDVFVVGEEIDEVELARRTSEAGALLGREINTVIYSRSDLEAKLERGNRYLERVLRQPKIRVFGNEVDLAPQPSHDRFPD